MSKKPGGRLTVMVMLFYFTAFLLLALRNAVWQGYALALCVPAAIWGGTHILGKCFHIDTLLFSLTNFLCALGILILLAVGESFVIDWLEKRKGKKS